MRAFNNSLIGLPFSQCEHQASDQPAILRLLPSSSSGLILPEEDGGISKTRASRSMHAVRLWRGKTRLPGESAPRILPGLIVLSQNFLFGNSEGSSIRHTPSFWSDWFRGSIQLAPKGLWNGSRYPFIPGQCLVSKRFLRHCSVPYIPLDGFLCLPGGSCYPAGTGSASIRRTMAPKSRRVR